MLVLLCGVTFVASAEEKATTQDKKIETQKQEVPEDEDVDLDMMDEDILDDMEMDPSLLGMRGNWGLRGSMSHRHMLGARPWMLRGSMLGGRRHSLMGMRGLWDDEDIEDDVDVEEDPTLMIRRAMLMRRACLPGQWGCRRRWMLRRPAMWSRWGKVPRRYLKRRPCMKTKKTIVIKKMHDEEEKVDEPTACQKCKTCQAKCAKGKVCCPKTCKACEAKDE
jgi:hypothetical protein